MVPKKILKMLKEKRLLDEMADKPKEKWGWKVIEGFYNQLIEMLRTMELSRDWTEARKVGDSHTNQEKVRIKSVTVRKMKCIFCTEEGRPAEHWALNKSCNSQGLSVDRMEEIIRKTQSCPTCLQKHTMEEVCDDKTPSGAEKKCRQGCRIDNVPLGFWACKHGRTWRATVAVATGTGSLEEHVPQVETLETKRSKLLIKYDTGSTLTLITREALTKLDSNQYQLGRKRMVQIANHTGAHLDRELLQEITINLNNVTFNGLVTSGQLGSIEDMDVQVPQAWMKEMGCSSVHLEGPVDILAGSQMGRLYPNQCGQFEGLKLFKSVLTGKYMMFGYKEENKEYEKDKDKVDNEDAKPDEDKDSRVNEDKVRKEGREEGKNKKENNTGGKENKQKHEYREHKEDKNKEYESDKDKVDNEDAKPDEDKDSRVNEDNMGKEGREKDNNEEESNIRIRVNKPRDRYEARKDKEDAKPEEDKNSRANEDKMGKAGEEEDTDKGRSDFGKKENKQQDEPGAYKESKNEGYKNNKTWKPMQRMVSRMSTKIRRLRPCK